MGVGGQDSEEKRVVTRRNESEKHQAMDVKPQGYAGC